MSKTKEVCHKRHMASIVGVANAEEAGDKETKSNNTILEPPKMLTSTFRYNTIRMFIAAVLLTAMAFQDSLVRADETIYGKVLHSSVWIRRVGKNTGSGVLVDAKRQWIITNYHVVEESDTVLVYFPEVSKGRVIAEEDYYRQNTAKLAKQGRVIARVKKLDLAIIEVGRLPATAKQIKMATDSPRQGQAVHSVANQGGSGALWTYTDGKVRSVLQRRHTVRSSGLTFVVDARTVVTSLASNPGDSGGPVVNDRGELVAVVSSGNRKAENVCFCIDVTEINALVQKTKVGDQKIEVAGGGGNLIPDLIGSQKEAKAPAQKFSLVGVWSSGLTLKNGKRAGIGLEMKADGTFELVMNQSGKMATVRGTWDLKESQLTFTENGRVLMSGRLQVNRANSWTLVRGNRKQTFTKFVPRRRVQNQAPPVRQVRQTQPPAQKFSLVGTWSSRLTLKDGTKVGVGLEMKADGSFEFLLIRADGKRVQLKGTWQLKGQQLTFFENGRATMGGRLQINSPTSWTLVSRNSTQTFTRFVPRRNRQQQPVRRQPARPQVAGTTWSGNETLQNFGALTFQFQPNGTAIMIDTSGRSQGTWSVAGNRVTISFNNGQIVYVGTITGNTMTGEASNSNGGSWRFTVRRGSNRGA